MKPFVYLFIQHGNSLSKQILYIDRAWNLENNLKLTRLSCSQGDGWEVQRPTYSRPLPWSPPQQTLLKFFINPKIFSLSIQKNQCQHSVVLKHEHASEKKLESLLKHKFLDTPSTRDTVLHTSSQMLLMLCSKDHTLSNTGLDYYLEHLQPQNIMLYLQILSTLQVQSQKYLFSTCPSYLCC